MNIEEIVLWAITKKIKKFLLPDKPSITSIVFEEARSGYDFYRVSISPPTDEDLVVKHELIATGVEGSAQVREVVNGTLVHFPKDRDVVCVLVAIDSFGFRSTPSDPYSFSTFSTQSPSPFGT